MDKEDPQLPRAEDAMLVPRDEMRLQVQLTPLAFEAAAKLSKALEDAARDGYKTAYVGVNPGIRKVCDREKSHIHVRGVSTEQLLQWLQAAGYEPRKDTSWYIKVAL